VLAPPALPAARRGARIANEFGPIEAPVPEAYPRPGWASQVCQNPRDEFWHSSWRDSGSAHAARACRKEIIRAAGHESFDSAWPDGMAAPSPGREKPRRRRHAIPDRSIWQGRSPGATRAASSCARTVTCRGRAVRTLREDHLTSDRQPKAQRSQIDRGGRREKRAPCIRGVADSLTTCTAPDFLDSFFDYHHAAASRASSL